MQGNPNTSGKTCALIKILAAQRSRKISPSCHMCKCTAAASIQGFPLAMNTFYTLDTAIQHYNYTEKKTSICQDDTYVTIPCLISSTLLELQQTTQRDVLGSKSLGTYLAATRRKSSPETEVTCWSCCR